MTDSKEWCDGDWRCRSSSKPFAGAESGSPGRALEAGKRGSPGWPVQAGISRYKGEKVNKGCHSVKLIDRPSNLCCHLENLDTLFIIQFL